MLTRHPQVSASNLLIWAASETSVTIIAASIPYLRLIAKEVSQRSKRSTSNTYGLDYLGTHKSGVVGRTSRHIVVEARGRQDDQSDRSILGEVKNKQSGILQTNEINIEYYDGDAESRDDTRKREFD
jgi:hypothetical protein